MSLEESSTCKHDPDTMIVSEKFQFPPGLMRMFAGMELSAPLCVGCQGPIHDQFILRVSPDLSWHAACLKVLVDVKQLLG